VHNLTDGRQNNIFLICKSPPPTLLSSITLPSFCSRAKRNGRVQARRTRHLGPRAQVATPCARGRPRVVLQPPLMALRPRVARLARPRHARHARCCRSRARSRRALGPRVPPRPARALAHALVLSRYHPHIPTPPHSTTHYLDL
jgi:hypothetical protein